MAKAVLRGRRRDDIENWAQSCGFQPMFYFYYFGVTGTSGR